MEINSHQSDLFYKQDKGTLPIYALCKAQYSEPTGKEGRTVLKQIANEDDMMIGNFQHRINDDTMTRT